jgi:hypothetical protein
MCSFNKLFIIWNRNPTTRKVNGRKYDLFFPMHSSLTGKTLLSEVPAGQGDENESMASVLIIRTSGTGESDRADDADRDSNIQIICTI